MYPNRLYCKVGQSVPIDKKHIFNYLKLKNIIYVNNRESIVPQQIKISYFERVKLNPTIRSKKL